MIALIKISIMVAIFISINIVCGYAAIVVEGATNLFEKNLLWQASPNYDSRIIVEYATEIVNTNLIGIDYCNCDLNFDGNVNYLDLRIFAEDYGNGFCDNCISDFNNDQDIDGSDLFIYYRDDGRNDCPFFPSIP